MKIAVTSTFDIDPTNDGGRRRYRAVLGELSKHHDVTVIGYHIGGSPGVRSYRLGTRFQVHVASTADGDARHCWHDYKTTNRIAHDVFCVRTYLFSDDFLRLCARHIADADVVIVAHPYLIMPVLRYRPPSAIQIYESYNVEYDAKMRHFAGIDERIYDEHLTDVAYAERLACQTSNYVTAVSEADARRLEALYDLSPGSVHVAANGVVAASYPRFSTEDKAAFRAKIGIPEGDDVAVFVGSAYGPNIDSYQMARGMLQAAGFKGSVVLVGSISQANRAAWPAVSFKEFWLGFVADEVRNVAVGCSDIALQFISTGAGTNLKLFDYMASYTLIIANEFGARGVPGEGWCLRAESSIDLAAVLARKPWREAEGETIVNRARDLVLRHFDWSGIAAGYHQLISGGRSPVAPQTG